MPNGLVTHLKILIMQLTELGRNEVTRKRHYSLGVGNLGLCKRSSIGYGYLIDDSLFYLIGEFGMRNQ